VLLLLAMIMYWGFLLVLSPVMLWYVLDPRWHTTLAIAYAAIAIVAFAFWIRHILRERAEILRNPAAAADWRWPPGTSPEMFRRKIELYLSMRGWRVDPSRVTTQGRVELIARLDRCSIGLLFVNPRQPAGQAADVYHLQALCDAARTPFAALVTTAPATQEALAAVRDPNVLLLRYADLERLEEIISMATWRYTTAASAPEPTF
jgi:hypothetical protein